MFIFATKACKQTPAITAGLRAAPDGPKADAGDIVYVLLLLQYSKAKAFSTSFQLLLPSEKGWGNVLLKPLNWQKWPQFTFKMKLFQVFRTRTPAKDQNASFIDKLNENVSDGFNFSFLNAVPSKTIHSVLNAPILDKIEKRADFLMSLPKLFRISTENCLK